MKIESLNDYIPYILGKISPESQFFSCIIMQEPVLL